MFTPAPVGRLTREQVHEMFLWLDDVRGSGIVNMFGAYPLLAEAFSIPRPLARQVWTAWAQSFGTRHGAPAPDHRKHPPTPQHDCTGGCGRRIGVHVERCWRCRTKTTERGR